MTGTDVQLPVPPNQVVVHDPLDRIARLLSQGVKIEDLDKLLEVQQRWDRENARKAYVRAMAAFKAEPLTAIKKGKTVRIKLKGRDGTPGGGGEFSYKHETLAQVVKAAVSAMAKHGLSHSWEATQDPETNVITVACVLTHEEGHSERVALRGAPDSSGQKNPLQEVRSTITFLQRATLLLITGLAAEDGSDDDANSAFPTRPASADAAAANDAPPGKATAAQLKILRKMLGDRDEAEFAKSLGVERLEDLTFDRVNEGIEAVRPKKVPRK